MRLKLKVILPNGFSYDWEYEGTSLSIGRDPTCDMAVDETEHRQVSWMHAQVECEKDQVVVRDVHSKNGTYLNGKQIERPSRIGPGDTIQLGQTGPKIVVLEVQAGPQPMATPGETPGQVSDPMERRAAPPPSPPAPPVANGAAVAPAALASPQTAGLSLPWERWLVPAALVATTAVFIFLAAMLWLGGGNQDIPQVAEAVSTGDAQTEETEPSKTPAGSREKLDDGDDGRAASKDGSPENTATKPDDPPPPRGTDWQRVLADVRGGIFLLEARHPSGQATWPVANACTIRNDTLLTTGTAASALANFQKQGWKISARNPSDGTQRRVEKILVHRGYQEVPEEADAGKNDPRMYFDLALVTVDAKSSPTSPLGMAPTGAVEGQSVAGVGIPYDAERISSLDSHAAEIHSGKVFRIDLLADEPGSPVVIDARVAIPMPEGEAQGPYFVGSPLVDAQGRIVGLYSSPPLTAKAKSVDVHHFVEIGPVKLWLSGQATDSWVKPIVPVTP